MHNNPRKHSLSSNPDLFIAGGGPAGLACAIAAAKSGLSVQVADALRPPIDNACGEGLMPDSLAALSAWASTPPRRPTLPCTVFASSATAPPPRPTSPKATAEACAATSSTSSC